MTPARSFAGTKVALFGLGGSGAATARALAAGGADVAAWDDSEPARKKAREAGLPIIDLAAADWRNFAALVLAPGVPLTHPEPHWTVGKAQEAGVEIIGDIEIFCRERRLIAPSAPFVAITGTNGKSTTTALTAHLLREAGRDVQLGGNIGRPILDLEPPGVDRVHVIECSSFQIDLTPSLNPTVGALINLSPDHLDRHGTMANYSAIKERLVAHAEIALVGVDDEYCRAIAVRMKEREAKDGRPHVVTISAEPSDTSDVYVENRVILPHDRERMDALGNLARADALRGAHNGQNAAFACAAARALGVPSPSMQWGLTSFPGLAHRMEQIGRIGRTLFVNDSKATNADAAEKALLSFSDIFWIVGGKAKEGGIEPLRPLFPKIAKAYLIGASSEYFAKTLEGSVLFERCGTLDHAVQAAARDAGRSPAKEPVVLLSPACASYDQFANFEARGDKFRMLVKELIARSESSDLRSTP
jgi:UDP-N-acetylmuramoylalanine--D-glutamate ligase